MSREPRMYRLVDPEEARQLPHPWTFIEDDGTVRELKRKLARLRARS